MEKIFKFTFVLAIIIFCLIIVNLFLLILKIVLMFQPEINMLGLQITY